MRGTNGVEGVDSVVVGKHLGFVEMDEAPAVVVVVTRLLVPGHRILAIRTEHLIMEARIPSVALSNPFSHFTR
jgi:hypothetical protein